MDGPDFLAHHNAVWSAPPATWDAAAFIGNGLLGALIYTNGANELCWGVSRIDVTEQRDDPNPMFRQPRVPIGRIALLPSAGLPADPPGLSSGTPKPAAPSSLTAAKKPSPIRSPRNSSFLAAPAPKSDFVHDRKKSPRGCSGTLSTCCFLVGNPIAYH
jgi:hypothetical protein